MASMNAVTLRFPKLAEHLRRLAAENGYSWKYHAERLDADSNRAAFENIRYDAKSHENNPFRFGVAGVANRTPSSRHMKISLRSWNFTGVRRNLFNSRGNAATAGTEQNKHAPPRRSRVVRLRAGRAANRASLELGVVEAGQGGRARGAATDGRRAFAARRTVARRTPMTTKKLSPTLSVRDGTDRARASRLTNGGISRRDFLRLR